jgi:hypothetical protein
MILTDRTSEVVLQDHGSDNMGIGFEPSLHRTAVKSGMVTGPDCLALEHPRVRGLAPDLER